MAYSLNIVTTYALSWRYVSGHVKNPLLFKAKPEGL